MIASLVYLLCAVTSVACALLLLRGYLKSRERLLLWSGLCFVGLSISNIGLVIDKEFAMDLSMARSIPSLVGLMLLVFGLAWDSSR